MNSNSRVSALRAFGVSACATAVVLGLVFGISGASAAAVTAVLVAVEVAFSFDNAIVNAKTLAMLSSFWQRMFLSVGIVIAVLGMRIVFPVAIVAITARLGWRHVLTLALHNPAQYAAKLADAHTAIAAFGGSFLLLLGLRFFFDDSRDVRWLKRLEIRLQQLPDTWLPPLLTMLMLGAAAAVPANHRPRTTLVAGVMGILTYFAMQLVLWLAGAGRLQGGVQRTGRAALATFCYLELLDASFSFDGVLGAFAITGKVLLIAAGLGVGALWVRSLTVFMVRRGTLSQYIYLEHGAHYTILLLALLLLVGVFVHVPDAASGVGGLACLAAAFVASHRETAKR